VYFSELSEALAESTGSQSTPFDYCQVVSEEAKNGAENGWRGEGGGDKVEELESSDCRVRCSSNKALKRHKAHNRKLSIKMFKSEKLAKIKNKILVICNMICCLILYRYCELVFHNA
jgi:hypothetical protein